MTTPPPRLRDGSTGGHGAGRIVAVAAAAAVALVAVPVSASAAPPSGLSITATDGHTQVKPGASLAYTATITNSGEKPVRGKLVFTAPDYVTLSHAGKATVKQHVATWQVRVPAGKAVARKITVTLSEIPKDQLRVTTFASFYLGHGKTPTIRAADADHIAGVTDPRPAAAQAASPTTGAAAGRAAPEQDNGPNLLLVLVLPVVVAVLLAAGGLWWWWRRRGADASGPDPDSGHEMAHAGADQPIDDGAP